MASHSSAPYTKKVMPDAKLLSNGAYHVMITPAGGGYSRWKGLAVTRWREDATLDNWGAFCYLRDCADAAVWSTTILMISAFC